jgi:hypothetical protein
MRYLQVVMSAAILLILGQLVRATVFDQKQKDQLIEILEYIADGYESNVQNKLTLKIAGRIYREQRAQEGKTIPDNYVVKPIWLNYEYIQKGEKRLYWEDRLMMPGHKHYALDDNKILLTYATNVVRIYPMKNEEASWIHRTHYYGDFYNLSGASGFETVGLAMKSLIDEIKNGIYDQNDCNISVEASEDGLFTIKNRYGTDTYKWVIDSRKGFNLVGRHILRPSEKFYVEKHCEYEYQQLSCGAWILTNAKMDIIENGVVLKTQLETEQLEQDVEISDALFEKKNLVPPNIYTVDYTYSPPLEYNRGGRTTSDQLILDQLINTPLSRNEIASVHNDGNVSVSKHTAYDEYESETADNSPNTKRHEQESPKLSTIYMSVALIIAFLIISPVIAIRVKQKRSRS